MVKRIATNLDRLERNRIATWTSNQAGGDVDLRILERKLVAYIDPDEMIIGGVQGTPWAAVQKEDKVPETVPEPEPEPEPTVIEKRVEVPSPHSGDVANKVVEVVVKHTGYPEDFIELDQDLEGELGIDTVKQAEIMAELRDFYGLPVDESFVLSEHPTLNHMIAYLGQGEGEAPVVEPLSLIHI